MIRKMASIKITFYSILALTGLLFTGVGLSYFTVHQKAIDGLNSMLIHQWLTQNISKNIWASSWVILTCLASGVLFINALCCSATILLQSALKRSTLKQWSFFLMHIFFLVVMGCHGLSLISGEKTVEIELYPGESYAMPDNSMLTLKKTTFVDNQQLISMKMKKSRRLMTRKTFHADQNQAVVVLTGINLAPATGEVKMLSPLVHGGVRITLNRFLLKQMDDQRIEVGSNINQENTKNNQKCNSNSKSEQNQTKSPNLQKNIIGAAFTITQNKFTLLFFSAYGLLILSIIGYILFR